MEEVYGVDMERMIAEWEMYLEENWGYLYAETPTPLILIFDAE